MSHLLRVLLAVSVLAAPGAAYAQCTKDTDCKGDRVCERGACVSPSERTQPQQPEYTPPPPPPQPPPEARPAPRPRSRPAEETPWEATSRKNVLSYNVLSTLYGFYVAASLQGGDPGLSILSFSFLYERALLPQFALFAALSPSFWSDPTGGLIYTGLTVGAKWYPWGESPGGFWAGGELGNLPMNVGLGMSMEAGYQWLLDMGLAFQIVGGVTFAGAPAPATGIQAGIGFGGNVGWNF